MTEYTPTDAEIEAAAKALCEIDEMRLVLTFAEEAKAALVAAHKARQTHAHSEARAPEGWRDIASAPKDGTLIIVYRPTAERKPPAIPVISQDYWMTTISGRGCWAKSNESYQPTHWLPLSRPPTEGSDR